MIHDQWSIIFKSKYSPCTCTVEFCPLLQVELLCMIQQSGVLKLTIGTLCSVIGIVIFYFKMY